jgi:hypothetical protein
MHESTMPTDDDLVDAYRQATEPRTREDCPSAADLAAFAFGDSATDSLRDHVGGCAACAREFREVSSALPAMGGRDIRYPLAVAALLLLVFGLGGASSYLLRSQKAPVRATTSPVSAPAPKPELVAAKPASPEINVMVVDLLPPTAVVRGDAGADIAVVPADTSTFTVILNLEREVSFDDYALDILDAKGGVVWSSRGLRRSPQNTFTLHLSRAILESGTYRLVLFGLTSAGRSQIEAYRLVVARE